MNNIRATLAIVWRIAAPYFKSEDKWAGCILLASVIAIELALVGVDCDADRLTDHACAGLVGLAHAGR